MHNESIQDFITRLVETVNERDDLTLDSQFVCTLGGPEAESQLIPFAFAMAKNSEGNSVLILDFANRETIGKQMARAKQGIGINEEESE